MFSSEKDLFINLQAFISSRLNKGLDDIYLPNSYCEPLNNSHLENDPVAQKLRTKLNRYCDFQYSTNSFLLTDYCINEEFSECYYNFISHIIHFPKSIEIPIDKNILNSVKANGLLKKSKIDRLIFLINELFKDFKTYTVNDLSGKILDTYPNLITRYFRYKEHWVKGDNTPNALIGWHKYDCKNLTEEYLILRDELLDKNKYFKLLQSLITKSSLDNEYNTIIDLINVDISNHIYLPFEIESKFSFPIVEIFEHKLIENKEILGTSNDIEIQSFEVENVSFDLYQYRITRTWAFDDFSFINLLKSTNWCIKKDNLYYNSNKLVNQNSDDYLKTFVNSLVIIKNIKINLSSNNTNLTFYNQLSDTDKNNFRMFGFIAKLNNENGQIKVEISKQLNSDYYLVGLTSTKIKPCPNPDLVEYYWDEESSI